MKISWLWSPVYRGLEVAWRIDTARQRAIFLGWTSPEYKARGW